MTTYNQPPLTAAEQADLTALAAATKKQTLSLTAVEIRQGDRIKMAEGWAEVITPPSQNKHNPSSGGQPHVGFVVRYDDQRAGSVMVPWNTEVTVVRVT
jgi:hypothetical protein